MSDSVIYEIWKDSMGLTNRSTAISSAGRDLVAEKVCEAGYVPVYSIRAESWESMMQIHYDIEDLGVYRPMED